MFLKLTKSDGQIVYINFNKVRGFYECEHNNLYTVIDKEYGNDLVIESPEEIMEMLKMVRG